jgi:hypothetical protein
MTHLRTVVLGYEAACNSGCDPTYVYKDWVMCLKSPHLVLHLLSANLKFP